MNAVTSVRATNRSLAERWTALLSGSGEVGEPYDLYALTRREAPVFRYRGMTILTRHRDVKAVFRQGERFPPPLERMPLVEDSFALLSEEERGFYDDIVAFERLFIARKHGETHRRYRSAMHRGFTPRRIAEMRSTVEGIVDDVLAATVEGRDAVDLLDFCYRVPLLVITSLLGAPAEDSEQIKVWGDTVLGALMVSPLPPEPLRLGHRSLAEYREYAAALVASNRDAADRSGLVTLLMDAEAQDALALEELIATFLHLLFAGHETTTHLIGNGVFNLLRQPEQWAALCDDVDLVGCAVEEMLRFESVVQITPRVAAADDELDGIEIPADSTLLLVEGAANRDPEVFEDPDRFDIRRERNDHLSLGFGPHFCLGASLARMEAQIAITELSRRYPRMELAFDPADAPWGSRPRLRGLRSLQVGLNG